MHDNNIAIECIIDAIPTEKRDVHQQSAMAVLQAVIDVHETDDAYTLIMPVTQLEHAATWISLERLCCPFLDFTLRIEPATETLAITIGNGAEVKQLLEHELLVHVKALDNRIKSGDYETSSFLAPKSKKAK